MFDEISLEYWKNHRERVRLSKSYRCAHNGYVYGDDKKKIGEMSEDVVIKYEKQRLNELGHYDYANKIEHSSVTRGDGLGYDLVSYQEDGNKIYIEVKTTKQNNPAGFYLSKKELSAANEKYLQGEQYRLYRVYNLNVHQGTGDLVIYEPPFTSDNYSMEPENW